MPRGGNGPPPNISVGERQSVKAPPPSTTAAGRSMLPVPRTTLASVLRSQKLMAPAKTIFEYASAAARASAPTQPMKYTSPVLTIAWTAITAIFGAARRSKVGTIGASRRLRVRVAMGLLGEVESAGRIARVLE